MITTERPFINSGEKHITKETTVFIGGRIKIAQNKAHIDHQINSLKTGLQTGNTRSSEYYERIKPLRRIARAFNGSHTVKG